VNGGLWTQFLKEFLKPQRKRIIATAINFFPRPEQRHASGHPAGDTILPKQQGNATMVVTREKSWRCSEARRLLEQDLRSGVIPLDGHEMSVEECYTQRPEFSDFPFESFPRRLQALRKQCAAKNNRSVADTTAFAHDHALLVARRQGGDVLRWDGSEAERLLKLDIANGLHLNLTPKNFYQFRAEYQVHSLKVVRGHIHQELKRLKFVKSYYSTNR
jgi:hypothetical protein